VIGGIATPPPVAPVEREDFGAQVKRRAAELGQPTAQPAAAGGGEEAASDPSPARDAGTARSRLRQLKELEDRGLISGQEYEAKRRAIINSL